MPTRREILGTGAVAAGAVMAPAGGHAASDEPTLDAFGKGAALLRGGPLMNLERAYQVMAEEGLDGLIVTLPTNFFHFTGYYDHVAVRHEEPNSFALLARDEKQPPSIVMNQFLYYYSFVDSQFDWPGEMYLFTGWDSNIGDGETVSDIKQGAGTAAGGQFYKQEPKARAPFFFDDKGEAPQRDFETDRLEVLKATLKRRSASAGAEWGLIKAARNMGLNRGRIGIDDPVIAAIFESAGLGATTIDADHALRRIRMIKSAREIQLMRIGAQLNADAALAAVQTVREGATHRELRARFLSECAKRGNLPLFLQIDTVTSEVYDAELKEGAAFAIDAVSTGFHYYGDYGRTIFVGEPSRSMKRATDAIAIGWDAVREQLKPGLRYSEIRAIGREAIKKSGYDYDVAVTPHSVGLSHTDEPGRGGSAAYWAKDDLVLEENMIISVDLPVRHAGIGGSAHLEDLTLITKDGATQINEIGDRIVIV